MGKLTVKVKPSSNLNRGGAHKVIGAQEEAARLKESDWVKTPALPLTNLLTSVKLFHSELGFFICRLRVRFYRNPPWPLAHNY